MTRPLSVAHRGYSSRWPENTIASARAAIAAGADLVEADARFSADGTLYCFHDPDLSRLAGEDLQIAECNDAKLQSLRYLDEPPASFAEILAEVSGRAGLLVDVKLPGPEMTNALARAIGAAGWPSDVWLGIRSSAQAMRARAIFGTRVGIVGMIPALADADTFLAAGADALRLWEKHLDDEAAAALKARAPIWVTAGGTDGRSAGDVDDTALRRILDFGPHAVLVNDPTLLAAEPA